MNIKTMTAQEILDSNIEIRIVSGEGDVGGTEAYTGKLSMHALKSRLTRERYHDDC